MRIMATFILAAGLTLTSCATPPQIYSFHNTETFSITKEKAWERLLVFFTSNNIQIKTIEKESGLIYAERALIDASMADCGEPGLAIEVNRTGSMNVLVQVVSAKETRVTVNADFGAVRSFDRQIFEIKCNSTGVLEGQILRSIAG